MSIQIFTKITTEEILSGLEVEAKTYDGLYVDMEVKEERKYVKDKAALISNMLKKLDRARIDESKDYKLRVEAEAKSIRERLEAANLPFTALIDKHKEERAAQLAKEKATEDAKQLAITILQDHDAAIMEEKVRKFEKAEAEKLAKDLMEAERVAAAEAARIKAEADAQEVINEANRAKQEAVEAAKQAKIQAEESEIRLKEAENQAILNAEIAAENARNKEVARAKAEAERQAEEQRKLEANRTHVGAIRKAAKESLMEFGIDEKQAKSIVMAMHKGLIKNVTINY